MKDIYLVLFEKIEIWSIQKQALFLQQITYYYYHFYMVMQSNPLGFSK